MSKEQSEIPSILIYYFAHIPWHPDIWYQGEEIGQETKAFVQKHFEEFKKQEIIKLLSFIDEETSISQQFPEGIETT
jgi:hypothetical protein